jgi:hypothetical protein
MPDACSLNPLAWVAECKRGPCSCNGGVLCSLHPGLAPGCCESAALDECVLAVYRVHATPSVSADTPVAYRQRLGNEIHSLSLTSGRPPPPIVVVAAPSTSKASVNVAAIVVPVVVGVLLIVAACYAIWARWFRTGKVCAAI